MTAVRHLSAPDAIRRGLVQPLGAYVRPSGLLQRVYDEWAPDVTRSTGRLVPLLRSSPTRAVVLKPQPSRL
jgi:hypothetical protein